MAIFPIFFLVYIGQGNVFYDILERKNASLSYKNKKFKSQKIDIFSKGWTHGFGRKMATFPTFFLGNIGQENVFYDILERKMPFSAIKSSSWKERKIDIFPKGLTFGFGPKMANVFKVFFF